MSCPHATGCELYSQFLIESTLKVWKIMYCEASRHTQCARYKLVEEGKPVPLKLLPSGKVLS